MVKVTDKIRNKLALNELAFNNNAKYAKPGLAFQIYEESGVILPPSRDGEREREGGGDFRSQDLVVYYGLRLHLCSNNWMCEARPLVARTAHCQSYRIDIGN